MKLSLPLLLLFSLLLFSGVVSAGDGCTNAVANMSAGLPAVFNESCQLPPQNFYVNATSSSTGALTIIKDSVELDCSIAIIIGNGTGRGINSNKDNLTIKNCHIFNFTYGIYLDSTFNTTVKYNIINDTKDYGIFLRYSSADNNITNNNIYLSTRADTTNYGIYLDSTSGYVNRTRIENNYIWGGYHQIFSFKGDYSIIDNNTLINSTQNAIVLDRSNLTPIDTNNRVFNNFIENTTHNGIDINTNFNLIYDNVLKFTGHNGIDFFSDTSSQWSTGNKVYTNNISNPFCGGIYIANDNQTQVYGNRIINVSGLGDCTTTSIRAIQVDANSTTGWGSNIFNNYIDGVNDYSITSCALIQGYLTNFTNNTLLNCGTHTVEFQNYQSNEYGQGWLINNIINGVANYWIGRDTTLTRPINLSINESTSIYSLVNLSNNGTIKMIWNGNKDFKVLNSTVLITASDSNHNISCSKNGAYLTNNNQSLTIGVAANDNIVCQYSSASGGCDYPKDDYQINKPDFKLCNGRFYINDSNSDGVLNFTTNNVDVTCIGTIIAGNNTGRGVTAVTNRGNITMKGCGFENFQFGARMLQKGNITLYNNTFLNVNVSIRLSTMMTMNVSENIINNTAIGIYIHGGSNNSFIDKNIISNITEAGILFNGGGNHNATYNILLNDFNYVTDGNLNGIYNDNKLNSITIWNNKIIGFSNGIKISSYHDNANIQYNNVTKNGLWGIAVVTGNNSIIRNNFVNDSNWNGIFFEGYNHYICDNILDSFGHHGIDTHNDANVTISGNSIICNNLIYSSNVKGDMGMYIAATINNSIYNNTISSLLNETSRAIVVDGGNYSHSNRVYNNSLTSNNYCISDYSFNTTFSDNNYVSCSGIENGGSSDTPNDWNYGVYTNNVFPNNIGNYTFLSTGRTNISINENSNQHNFKWNGLNSYLYFLSPIRKVMNIVNNSISLFNLTDDYDCVQVFNGTSNLPWGGCGSGWNEYNESMTPNNRTFVFNYLTSTEPKYSTVGTGISYLTSINYTSKIASFSCTGSDTITVTNLNVLGSIIYVYKDGVLKETKTSITDYTTDGCSDWLFSGSALTYFNSETKPSIVGAYLAFAQMMSLVVILALLGGIVFVIYKFKEGGFNFAWDSMTFWLFGGAILLMIAVVAILIIVYIIATTSNILA